MTALVWVAIGLDAVLLVALLLLVPGPGGGNDGGREMGIIFGIAVPLVVVGLGALAFFLSGSMFVRVPALLVVAGPALFLGWFRGRSALIDLRARRISGRPR